MFGIQLLPLIQFLNMHYTSSRWFNTSEEYTVMYEFRYEPWVICNRILVPWYDARFRGYGQNKIVHLEHMNWTGYRWVAMCGYYYVEGICEFMAAEQSRSCCEVLLSLFLSPLDLLDPQGPPFPCCSPAQVCRAPRCMAHPSTASPCQGQGPASHAS